MKISGRLLCALSAGLTGCAVNAWSAEEASTNKLKKPHFLEVLPKSEESPKSAVEPVKGEDSTKSEHRCNTCGMG